MNYLDIHNAFIFKKDVSAVKDTSFYRYLYRNNIAYLYASTICRQRGKEEQRIMVHAAKLNEQYTRTLSLIHKVCKKAKIPFILFKTHKYIPEIVDGDIDLFVKSTDSIKFISALSDEGFVCIKEDVGKWHCTQSGFNKVEPRVDISHHGFVIIPEKEVWKYTNVLILHGMNIRVSTETFDCTAMLFNVLYGPKYVRFYDYLLYLHAGAEKLRSIKVSGICKEDIQLLTSALDRKQMFARPFPFYLSDMEYLRWWMRQLLPNRQISWYEKVRHFVFFYYSKYLYTVTGRPYFEHRLVIV